LMAALGCLPYSWMGPLGRGFGVLVYHLAGGERRKTIRNIQTAFPKGFSQADAEKLALSVWARLGWNLFETVRWLNWPRPKIASQVVRSEGWERVESAL